MENFVFSSKAKSLTGGAALLGLLCLIATYFVSPEGHHMRFWTNLLHNATFFTGIAFIACFAYGAFTTAYAGWFVQFKRVWESFGMFILPALFIFGVIMVGLFLHSHHLYHWADPAAVDSDQILNHKSAFLNIPWYVGATVVFLGVYYFLISSIRKISIAEDSKGSSDYGHHRRIKKWSAPMIAAIGFTSPFLIWLWIMSIDSHWYSTMFAWYASASVFVAMTALTIMILIYLKSRGYYPGVNAEHFHDLGKYLFAISIFWTYLWFSQFMLIWYGNVGEETIYFRERMDNYPALFWMNLGINFVLPFFVLMRNDTKRKAGTLFFASAMVFFGHWIDYFQMIKPGARLTLIEMEMHHGGHHGDDHSDAAHLGAHDDHHGEDHHAGDHHGNDHSHAAELGSGTHDDVEPTVSGYEVNTNEQTDEGNDYTYGDGHGTEESGHQGGHATDGESHLDVVGDGEGHGLAYLNGYTLPGLLEIGTFFGFLGGFLFFVLNSLSKAPLEPKRDPYFEESLHHHT